MKFVAGEGDHLGFLSLRTTKIGDYRGYSYNDSVTVIVKGIEREYPKILTIFVLLDVSNNNFTGEIPETIAHLEYLQLLNLSNNHFTGHIPRSFEQLKKLESLDFSSNNLSGNIPSQLTKLTFLALLNVSNNNFTGEIPETIGHLESLQLLNLSNNHFTGHIPRSFEQLTKLESLDFSSNNLSGNIPSQLTKLTFLALLNTSHNSLSGEIPHGNQFNTFDANSYLGNPQLCGKPLPKPCFEVKSPPSSATSPTLEGWKSMIDWNCFRDGTACGWGAGVILGIVIAKLVYGNPFVPPKTKRVRRIAVRPLRNYS
ncbi:Receptor-like protein 41 [Linum perenne]